MNKKTITVIFSIIIIAILYFCITNKNKLKHTISELKIELQNINNENKELYSKIKNRDDEIYELRFGKQKLFSEINELIKLKLYKRAKQKILTLKEKHPNAIETSKSEMLLTSINEEILWGEIQKPEFKSLKTVEAYISEFPNGRYINKVKQIRKEIKKEIEEKAYLSAKQKNTLYSWKKFLSEYPNHWDSDAIKKRIIDLEIDSIIGDSETGQLPSFSKTNYGYSSTSSVTIYNDTGYELTLRYSGPSIIKIVIPKGQSRTTTLVSGRYKISASAGGLHYGGIENLSGDYNARYYIKTTSYRY